MSRGWMPCIRTRCLIWHQASCSPIRRPFQMRQGRGGSPSPPRPGLEVVVVKIQPTPTKGLLSTKPRGSWGWDLRLSSAAMRPQPAGSCHPASQPLLPARAFPPSLLLLSQPQDTVFLLDLLLDLLAARAGFSPQLFCLASEILFILQGAFFFF